MVPRCFGWLVGRMLLCATFVLLLSMPLLAADRPVADHVFLLRLIDAATGQAIPLVEIEAFNALCYQSDNLGNIAIIEPDLQGKTLRFVVKGHGYRVPSIDLFGERSLTVKIVPGTSCTIALERTAIAERLYRITGSGRYRDSILAGIDVSSHPAGLEGDVIGLDSAVPVVWQNRLLSFYGDTLGPHSLNLSGSGAEIELCQLELADRPLSLKFFTDEDGFAKSMLSLPESGFVWIETVVPLIAEADDDKEVLGMRYVVHKTLTEAVETGFAVFDPLTEVFTPIKRVASLRHHKSARAFPVKYANSRGYCLQPWERVAANFNAFVSIKEYEYYTCLSEIASIAATPEDCQLGERYYKIERTSAGRPNLRWHKAGLPYNAPVQKQLLQKGYIKADDVWLSLIELGSGRRISDFTGSISYNACRERWIMFAQGNTGEIWYSEADTFTGPWLYARKIIEHDDYNFYNPVHHPWLDKDNGRRVYIEGTYTAFFTDKEHKTPRTDYNQVMYRLDLGDERLLIPQPVYRVRYGKNGYRLLTAELIASDNLWGDIEKVEFFAYTAGHGKSWLKPVYDHSSKGDLEPELLFAASASAVPMFYVIADSAGTVQPGSDSDILPELLEERLGMVLRADKALLTYDPEIMPDHTRNKLKYAQ